MTQFLHWERSKYIFRPFRAKEKHRKKIWTKIGAVTPTFHARGLNGTESGEGTGLRPLYAQFVTHFNRLRDVWIGGGALGCSWSRSRGIIIKNRPKKTLTMTMNAVWQETLNADQEFGYGHGIWVWVGVVVWNILGHTWRVSWSVRNFSDTHLLLLLRLPRVPFQLLIVFVGAVPCCPF